MRISRSDVDLWRAREMQGLRRLAEASPFASHEKRPEPSLKQSASRRRLVDRSELASAIPPTDDQLSDTAGNIAILRHLLDNVLPALELPDEVRQAAGSLLTEDMDHHLRVLDASLSNEVPPTEENTDEEQEIESDGRLA